MKQKWLYLIILLVLLQPAISSLLEPGFTLLLLITAGFTIETTDMASSL